MKEAVIIGRFQCEELTEGHKALIKYAIKEYDKVLILVGVAPVVSNKNPLPFSAVMGNILQIIPKNTNKVKISLIADHPSDKKWSERVDQIIKFHEFQDPNFIGSRDSFIKYYSGRFDKYDEFQEIPGISASKQREQRGKKILHDNRFYAGMIYATENRFPTAYPTVDIAVLKREEGVPTKILMGKKSTDTLYRLIGGFVDPSDESLEAAASRELHEEVGKFQHHGLKYVKSFKINDWRYKGTKDGIITTLFVTFFLSGQVKPSDDIEHLEWINLSQAELITEDIHKALIEEICKQYQ